MTTTLKVVQNQPVADQDSAIRAVIDAIRALHRADKVFVGTVSPHSSITSNEAFDRVRNCKLQLIEAARSYAALLDI